MDQVKPPSPSFWKALYRVTLSDRYFALHIAFFVPAMNLGLWTKSINAFFFCLTSYMGVLALATFLMDRFFDVTNLTIVDRRSHSNVVPMKPRHE